MRALAPIACGAALAAMVAALTMGVTGTSAAAPPPQPREPADGAVLQGGSPSRLLVESVPGDRYLSIEFSSSPARDPDGSFTDEASLGRVLPKPVEGSATLYRYSFAPGGRTRTVYWMPQRDDPGEADGVVAGPVYSFAIRAAALAPGVPLLDVFASFRQRVLRSHGVVLVSVCSRACSIVADARVRLRGVREPYRLTPVRRRPRRRVRTRIVLHLPRRTRRALSRAVRRGDRPWIAVAVRADAPGSIPDMVLYPIRVTR